jgi:hypothetical protein
MVTFFGAASHGEMRTAARETAIKAVEGLILIFIIILGLVRLLER